MGSHIGWTGKATIGTISLNSWDSSNGADWWTWEAGQDATQETLFTVLDSPRQSTGWRSMEKFNYKLIPQCAGTTPYWEASQQSAPCRSHRKRTKETRNLNKFPQNTKKKLICSVCSQAVHEEWRCTTRYLLEWIELQFSANIHRWGTTGTN